MNKYKLNFLRWITRGELPDKWLKTMADFKTVGNKFKFKIKADVDYKDWQWCHGSAK